jgi:outer membrane protein assembly factor BamB
VFVGDLDGKLHAVDLTTGKARWTYAAGAEIKSSPAVADGVVYFGDEAGRLHAVEAASGKARWTLATEAEIPGSPNVAGDCELFGSYGFLRVVDLATGAERSKIALGGYVGGSAALAGGHAYVGTFENQVLSVDLDRGAVAWRYTHPARQFPYYSSPAVTDRLVLVGGRDKMMHALDRQRGTPGGWWWAATGWSRPAPAAASSRSPWRAARRPGSSRPARRSSPRRRWPRGAW